jgi:hypothetical protein
VDDADITTMEPVPTATHALLFFDLAGLPGWGSEAGPTDPDTSTVLERYLGGVAGEVRQVQGYTVLAVATDMRRALHATLDLLGEAARSSGSAVAGVHVTEAAPEEVGPSSRAARIAATLAGLAEADRVLVTGAVIAALDPSEGSTLSFDAGPTADVDGERFATYAVRRR